MFTCMRIVKLDLIEHPESCQSSLQQKIFIGSSISRLEDEQCISKVPFVLSTSPDGDLILRLELNPVDHTEVGMGRAVILQ
jgi:hypothetical protein